MRKLSRNREIILKASEDQLLDLPMRWAALAREMQKGKTDAEIAREWGTNRSRILDLKSRTARRLQKIHNIQPSTEVSNV